MIDENHQISKSRPLLAMRGSGYNLGEFKILDIYLSRINPLDPSTAAVDISKDEYCAAMGIESGKVRVGQLKKYTKHFIGNTVEIPRQDGVNGYEQNVLFTKAMYDEDNEVITLVCNPDPVVFNTFFNVKNVGYVRYILKNTLHLKSAYSYKLYMFLKSKNPATEFQINLSELKEKLEITAKRYESFKYFNQEILKLSVEEINRHTDTCVEYEKVTKGRLTRAIKFSIKTRKIVDDKQDKEQPGQPEELERNEILEGKFALWSEACGNEFNRSQLEELTLLADSHIDYDPIDPERRDLDVYHYLLKKHKALQNKENVKSRFGYMKWLVENDEN